ncbi:hypothetical protein DPEC_G00218490 [Dallia pectoralis]|uniref:Uncharacterized protein n=1 Tax=Dallia pectoralis TaxID=75939 RepID=A0ACC2G390_DALPE|nr:hypothetical protein DPEC_G00218490 [Dallia pectoralis]
MNGSRAVVPWVAAVVWDQRASAVPRRIGKLVMGSRAEGSVERTGGLCGGLSTPVPPVNQHKHTRAARHGHESAGIREKIVRGGGQSQTGVSVKRVLEGTNVIPGIDTVEGD